MPISMGIGSEMIRSRVSQHSEVARAEIDRSTKLPNADRQKNVTGSQGNCVLGCGEVLDLRFANFQWVLGLLLTLHWRSTIENFITFRNEMNAIETV
jgi:hypothetical protein